MNDLNFFRIKTGTEPYRVEALVTICGKDVFACFGGGSAYHIGASALAVPRASLADCSKCSASVSVLCVTGHKDDMLCREAALSMCSALNTVVAVTVGMHIDNASPREIQLLSDNFRKAVIAVTDNLKGIASEAHKCGSDRIGVDCV